MENVCITNSQPLWPTGPPPPPSSPSSTSEPGPDRGSLWPGPCWRLFEAEARGTLSTRTINHPHFPIRPLFKVGPPPQGGGWVGPAGPPQGLKRSLFTTPLLYPARPQSGRWLTGSDPEGPAKASQDKTGFADAVRGIAQGVPPSPSCQPALCTDGISLPIYGEGSRIHTL